MGERTGGKRGGAAERECRAYAPGMELTRQGRTYTLCCEQWLPVPREDLFPFFADAYNLELITPDSVEFHVVTPRPIEMRAGALIDYRLRVRGLPVSWRTRIEVWEPPHRFVDVQLKGPYKLWRHEHRFLARDGGTLCLDRVDYEVPGGVLGPVVNRLFVEGDVRTIFRYREAKLEELFGDGQRGSSRAASDDESETFPGGVLA